MAKFGVPTTTTTAWLRSFALIAAIIEGIFGELSISHFACNNTWNPSVDCSAKIPISALCPLQLTLAVLDTSDNGTAGSATTGKPTTAKPNGAAASQSVIVQLLVTTGMETLRGSSAVGIDYWIAGSTTVIMVGKEGFNVPLASLIIQMPNVCGQTYIIARVKREGETTFVDQSTPISIRCPEKSVDLSIVGQTQEPYDMYSQRPVIHGTEQPVSYFIPDFKLFVKNNHNSSFTSRMGPSAYTIWAYLKPQMWYMYQWLVGDKSNETAAHVGKALLDFQLGDVMLHEGNELVETSSGKRTLAIFPGYSTEVKTDRMVLKSRSVCGNGIMVVQLRVPHLPQDSNTMNNYYILPVFVDCWGHNPVQSIETCQVIPNYYDGGQTAWITYTVPGQTKVYEYKSEERSVRPLNSDLDLPILQDVALMKLTTEVQSDRLILLDQCVNTMWGAGDYFVTSLDVLVSSVTKLWDEVKPVGPIQKLEHAKISTILNAFSDLLTLALQPTNPCHNWLHIPFQYIYNPVLPSRHYSSHDESSYSVNTNQVSGGKKKREAHIVDAPSNDFEDFELAAAAKAEASSFGLPSSTTPSSKLASATGSHLSSTSGGTTAAHSTPKSGAATTGSRSATAGGSTSAHPGTTKAPASTASSKSAGSTNAGSVGTTKGPSVTAGGKSAATTSSRPASTTAMPSSRSASAGSVAGSTVRPLGTTADARSGRMVQSSAAPAAGTTRQSATGSAANGRTYPSTGSPPAGTTGRTGTTSRSSSSSGTAATPARNEGSSTAGRTGSTTAWSYRTTGQYGSSNSYPYSSPTPTFESQTPEDLQFGPKSPFHRTIMEVIYNVARYSGEDRYILSPQRWQALSVLINTLLYGTSTDYQKYSYIPKNTMDSLVQLMKMAVSQNGPRLFDNIPEAVLLSLSKSMQKRWGASASACDYQELLQLGLNITEELKFDKKFQSRLDQLTLLSHVFRIFLAEDHTDYLAELHNRILAASKLERTWMIRDGVPIHEPTQSDICNRYAAVKLWQLQSSPNFQFAGRSVAPDQYKNVYWIEELGTIFRGDRSELTGQVFWTKVATCSCPAGSVCGAASENTAYSGYGPASNSTQMPFNDTKRTSMPAAALYENDINEIRNVDTETMALYDDNSNTGTRRDGDMEIEAAEDMLFSE